MPTYAFRCASCGNVAEAVLSIRAYCENPPAFVHCGEVMGRYISVAPGAAISNTLAGDRHYDGMRAPDGTDISTRSKHRQYMKDRNLTTIDDFSSTWKKDATERANRLAGHDPSRKHDLAAAIEKLGG